MRPISRFAFFGHFMERNKNKNKIQSHHQINISGAVVPFVVLKHVVWTSINEPLMQILNELRLHNERAHLVAYCQIAHMVIHIDHPAFNYGWVPCTNYESRIWLKCKHLIISNRQIHQWQWQWRWGWRCTMHAIWKFFAWIICFTAYDIRFWRHIISKWFNRSAYNSTCVCPAQLNYATGTSKESVHHSSLKIQNFLIQFVINVNYVNNILKYPFAQRKSKCEATNCNRHFNRMEYSIISKQTVSSRIEAKE